MKDKKESILEKQLKTNSKPTNTSKVKITDEKESTKKVKREKSKIKEGEKNYKKNKKEITVNENSESVESNGVRKSMENIIDRENPESTIYKLKISKNSIKSKNIEVLYPNNIGVKETKSSYLILYKDKKVADKDLKNNETDKFIRNKLIITNFSYKETEESIKDFLKRYGEVTEIVLEKTKEGRFSGKAIVSFSSNINIQGELTLNNKILRVERLKKMDVNDKRIFIGRINMNLSILEIRNLLKKEGVKPTDIRIRFEKDTHKNIGYGHLTFKDREDALLFEKSFKEIKKGLGEHAFYEYAKEKYSVPKK